MKPTDRASDYNVLSGVQGCLLGAQIGDAMGMPWEIMTAREIAEATDGSGVTGFSDPVQQNLKSTMGFKAGDTTDDWQLTRAVARSLIRERKFDILDVAREHVVEFDQSTRGWGRSTKDSVAEVKEWFASKGARGRNPRIRVRAAAPGQGTGNGVAMKVAPIGLFYGLQDDPTTLKIRDAIERLGLMTHADVRAWHAAYALAMLIKALIRREALPQLLEWTMTHVGAEEQRSRTPIVDPLSGRLLPLKKRALQEDPVRLRETTGTSCFVLESVPFVIGTFLRHETNFRAGVLEAVNAGGDTDSNASMVGAMIGANVGLEGIPAEWRNFRPEYREALALGEALFRAAIRSE